MDNQPPPLLGILLLGTTLLATGGLLWLWTGQDGSTPRPAEVEVRIVDPKNELIFFGDALDLDAGRAHVLGALIEASETGNFTVDVTYGYFGMAFVRSIAGIENEGACGWVWDLNDVRGDRAADTAPVQTGDRVLWHWGCEG